jgi:hypothetical protein
MFDARRIAADLREAVDEGLALILAAPEERTARHPQPHGWCAREIIGHLIDSACNNHRRFIINQSADRLIVDSYDQNEWVAKQRYAEQPAARLAALWAVYNRHLATVIEQIPDDVLNRERGPIGHLGFGYVTTSDSLATIGHLAEDYVGHIRHHLGQIRRLLVD